MSKLTLICGCTTPSWMLPYLAGIVDGEGYIGVKRERNLGRVTLGYHARLAVKMNQPAPAVRLLHATFGGRCAPERKMLCWQVTDASAERALTQLLPFLIVKRAAAENAIALRLLQRESREHRTKIVGSRNFPNGHGTVRIVPTRTLSDDYISRCDAFWARAKVINHMRGGDAVYGDAP